MPFKLARMRVNLPWSIVAALCGLLASFGAALRTTAADAPVPAAKTSVRNDSMVQAVTTPANKFCAVLPDGATVELVGVGESAGEGKAWWNADGSSRPMPSHMTRIAEPTPPPKNGPQRINRVFLFVCRHKQGASLAAPFFVGLSESGTGSWSTELLGTKQTEVALSVEISPQARATVRLKYTAGEWTTVATCSATHGTAVATPQGGVLFGDPVEKEGVTAIPLAVKSSPEDCQIDAVDEASRVHHSTFELTGLAEDIRLLTLRFPKLPLRRIKEFRLQMRTWRQVEFRNISLHGGQKTNFAILVDAKPSPAGPAKATKE